MNTNLWNRIRYTAYAPVYDLVARRLARGRRRSIALLDVQRGERVLIDGCGTGLDLELLPDFASITATDLTPAMVEKTRARAAALGMTVDARVMDAAKLDFPDESFDCVILHLILAIVPDPQAAAREAARVLRRGGRAVIFDKFVRDDREPSLVRKLLNVATNFIATDITRRVRDIIEGTDLEVVHDEGGLLRVLLLSRR